MTQYRQVFDFFTGGINPNVIQRIADGAFIPCDERNNDYLVFLRWAEGGGVIQPADAGEP